MDADTLNRLERCFSPPLTLTAAIDRDVFQVAENLRVEHRREIGWLTGLWADGDINQAVHISAALAQPLLALRDQYEAIALIGVEKPALLAEAGRVWLLSAPDIDRYALPAALGLKRLFAQAHRLAEARVLEQVIPPWYLKGRKWLRWLGWQEAGERLINGNPHIVMRHQEAIHDA